MKYDVIVVGAGASGLMAAIAAARKGSSVLVIEHMDKAGKKILATGNGKCNFTNRFQTSECYRSNDSAFAMKVLSCFDVEKTIQFFGELGIYPKERDGYLYPNSEQAASVVQVLMMECERLNVTFAYHEKVIKIMEPYFTVITEHKAEEQTVDKNTNRKSNKISGNKLDNKSASIIYNSKEKNASFDMMNDGQDRKLSDNTTYYGRKLILAAGGCASPKLGSDGSGYELAKTFGHSLIKPLPALVQLKSPEKYCKTITGVRVTADVRAYSENTILAGEEGEIIFTDYGISGIPVMQLSRYVAKALDQGKQVALHIDFMPKASRNDLRRMLQDRRMQNPRKTLEQMLIGLFNHKLSYVLILQAGLDPYKIIEKVTPQEIDELVNQMKDFIMKINATNDFENAQVCTGGVPTTEMNEESMESKLVRNLYFCGELVDVDGTCGGYNLQWAWSSGYLAGTSAGRDYTR